MVYYYVSCCDFNINVLIMVGRVNDPKLMRASCRAFDGLHFNSAGYKVMMMP